MAVQGVKIKVLDRDLMRRFGGAIIECDPNMAKIFVNNGKAKYVVQSNQFEENKTINIIKDGVNSVKSFFRETIFPESIIMI